MWRRFLTLVSHLNKVWSLMLKGLMNCAIFNKKMHKKICQKRDLNPRPLTRTRMLAHYRWEENPWVWRLRPLGHPDLLWVPRFIKNLLKQFENAYVFVSGVNKNNCVWNLLKLSLSFLKSKNMVGNLVKEKIVLFMDMIIWLKLFIHIKAIQGSF